MKLSAETISEGTFILNRRFVEAEWYKMPAKQVFSALETRRGLLHSVFVEQEPTIFVPSFSIDRAGRSTRKCSRSVECFQTKSHTSDSLKPYPRFKMSRDVEWQTCSWARPVETSQREVQNFKI